MNFFSLDFAFCEPFWGHLLLQFFFLYQEPITRSEQLPCARVTAFLRTSLFFSNGFGANFEFLLNPTNQSAKPTDLKFIFCLLITFGFPF